MCITNIIKHFFPNAQSFIHIFIIQNIIPIFTFYWFKNSCLLKFFYWTVPVLNCFWRNLCLFVCFCFVLFCFVFLFCLFVCLFVFVLFCFVLFCFVLFCFVLFCFVLFCFVLFVLFCFVLFNYFYFYEPSINQRLITDDRNSIRIRYKSKI